MKSKTDISKLKLFLTDLLKNEDKLSLYDSGTNATEIGNNRKKILLEAGINFNAAMADLTAAELKSAIENNTIFKNGSETGDTICELIRKQKDNYPHKIAIIDGDLQIDYSRLIKRSNEVAGELLNQNIEPGSIVGVCMNRSWELVATLLGVMQAGCTYLPLDPAYPGHRIAFMLRHSFAKAVITDSEGNATLCKDVDKRILIQQIGEHSDPVIRASASNLAYVIYTSGSTGKPKGVAIEHQSIANMSRAMDTQFSTKELDGMLAAASVCFDTSVMEIFGTLSLGGTIILAKNALELNRLPAVDKVRTVVMVASAMQALLITEDLPKGIQCLVFGGEALKRSLVDQVYALKPGLRILNAYGPTEDTVYSTIAEVSPDTKTITIGKSVPGSRAYILNDALKPVSDGEAGELFLAGNKLACGYLHEKTLTEERFLCIEPSNEIPDSRLYKTGDLCRGTANGEIEFLGRADQQVKIRGYRIELEEIESIIESISGIDAAAAIAAQGGNQQKILVAYVVSHNNPVSDEIIRSQLSKKLPGYMVPQVIRYLDALPLLPNDKLDRKKLIHMEEAFRQKSTASVHAYSKSNEAIGELIKGLSASENNLQQTFISVIQKEVASLLNLGNPENIKPSHSFDSYGLDSLTILEFASRLTKISGKKLQAQTILENPTPEMLSAYLANDSQEKSYNEPGRKKSVPQADTLSGFQMHIQSSHPTFQAAKATAWSVSDKSILVQEVMKMVNTNKRNPYSKVLKTGSATRGIVGDAYNDEEQQAIIWTTNLYLGLNRDPEVIKEAGKSLKQYGTGMGTSAAASGLTGQHLEFEKEFAELVGKPAACLFPTGYTANVGAVAGLLGKNDIVVIDQLCHASIVDGARLCGATIRTFKHNNTDDLEEVLKSEVSPYRTILVVLEGVYSMGEGAAPVSKIVRTAKKYNALVLVDEAHSFGFYGENGAGICAAQGISEQADFIMTTLSKALGSLGGVVAASQEHIDLLKSSSRAYIFQASISPADMAAALTALRRLRSDEPLRKRLWDTTKYMRKCFEEAGYDLGTGDGPIVTPHFNDKDKLYAIVQSMYKRGIQTSAVTYPIVESGKGRLRLICSAAHTREDVDKTIAALLEAEEEVDVILKEKRNKKGNTTIVRGDLEMWAKAFSAYLKEKLAEIIFPVPDLTISIGTSKDNNPVSISVISGTISLNDEPKTEIPGCFLEIKDQTVLNALHLPDIQKLLECICNGNCDLKGQTEPFIWLIGRIAELEKHNSYWQSILNMHLKKNKSKHQKTGVS